MTGPDSSTTGTYKAKEPALIKPLKPVARMVASLGTAFVVLILGVVTYVSLVRVRDSRAWVEHSHQTIDLTRGALSDLKDAETGQRGFILTGDKRYLAPYTRALSAIGGDTSALRALTSDNPGAQRTLDTLGRQISTKLAELDSTVTLRRTSGFPAAVALVQSNLGKNDMDRIRGTLGVLEANERRLLAARATQEERYASIVTMVLIGGTLVTIVIAMLLNGILTRYAELQAAAARELRRQNKQLDEQNSILESQSLELELQNQQLQDQASELELQQQHLQEQATEVEAQNEQLQQQASELEMQAEELQATTEALQDRSDEAERACVTAESARTVAETANRAKSDFLATMSHELRTPLNAIGGYVELMELGLRGPVTPEQVADLARIKRSGRHLLGLINDILNFAKLEAGKVEIRVSEVSVFDLVGGVEALIAPQLQAKGIRVVYDRCDPDLIARADAEKVQQILLNLLTNALKFTSSGGEIKILCASDGPWAIVSVDDTGCGISADKLDSVFEPFVQIDRQLASQPGIHVQPGVGLGLAISRELARAMGGEISATSRVGVGSVFTLALPLVADEQNRTAHFAAGSADASHPSRREASHGEKTSGVDDETAASPDTAAE